ISFPRTAENCNDSQRMSGGFTAWRGQQTVGKSFSRRIAEAVSASGGSQSSGGCLDGALPSGRIPIRPQFLVKVIVWLTMSHSSTRIFGALTDPVPLALLPQTARARRPD